MNTLSVKRVHGVNGYPGYYVILNNDINKMDSQYPEHDVIDFSNISNSVDYNLIDEFKLIDSILRNKLNTTLNEYVKCEYIIRSMHPGVVGNTIDDVEEVLCYMVMYHHNEYDRVQGHIKRLSVYYYYEKSSPNDNKIYSVISNLFIVRDRDSKLKGVLGE